MTPQNKTIIWAFIRSLLITTGVAIGVGICVGLLFGYWFAGILGFIITFILQLALGSIIASIADRRNKDAEFLAEQVLKEASERKLPFTLNCAYCNTLNRIGISFDKENIFNCTQCQQPNKVYIQFSTVRITTPLTQKERGVENIIEIPDEDTGISQSTVNEPIVMNEK